MPSLDRGLRIAAVVLLALLAWPAWSRGAEPRDQLASAHLLYNQGEFAAAVEAADAVRLLPGYADRADLVAARALIERFRLSGAAEDLTAARERLRRIDPGGFTGRERLDYLVGLGETLYYGEAYGASADVFVSALAQEDVLPVEGRERVVDWWASALDRDARPRPDIDRQAIYRRIRQRMEEELMHHPASAAAAYWLVAAARGEGDLQAAWNAAEAAWVRAPLAGDRAAELRGDLDRLVLRAIVPERARMLAESPDALTSEWEGFKERWSK